MKKKPHLNVQNNGMDGGLDGIAEALSKLKVFFADNNSINAPLPDEITELDQLKTLSLWDSGLTGHISGEIGHLKKLGLLNLSNNSLEGSVPSSMTELLKEKGGLLYYADLSDNTDLNWGTPVTIDGLDTTVLDAFKASQDAGDLTTFEYD